VEIINPVDQLSSNFTNIKLTIMINKNAKTMYYCVYQNCYYYTTKSREELIKHYVEYHGEALDEAQKLSMTRNLTIS